MHLDEDVVTPGEVIPRWKNDGASGVGENSG
jgi:hypothetical protein